MDAVITEMNRLFTDASFLKEQCVALALRLNRWRDARDPVKRTEWTIFVGWIEHRYYDRTTGREMGGGGSHWFATCIGTLVAPNSARSVPCEGFADYLRTETELHWRYIAIGVKDKCGVEVVGMRPHAKGSTYSNHCLITVADLKKRCKENGIKGISKMDKVALLATLMKV